MFPFFSIIIPSYNRPQQLQQCLGSLTRLSYPKDKFEVIVVDDGSPEKVAGIVEPFAGPLDIHLLRQENAGPASARNNGAQRARGHYLAFIDDDCQPSADWLDQMAGQLRKTPDRLLGGKTVNILERNLFSSASQFIVDIVYDHYNQRPDEARFFASNNMIVPKGIYLDIGGFPTSFRRAGGEDRELCDRWLWKGYKMSFVEKAIVYHAHDLSLMSYCKQHFAYGIGAYYYHRIRKERQSGTMAKEMKFHTNLRNWLLAPFTRKERRPVTMIFLLLLWQLANLAGFVWAASVEKPSS